MDEFKLFVINCHQIFFGLTLLTFVSFFLQDIREIKISRSLEDRKFLTVLLGVISLGTFFVLVDAWGISGVFFAFEFALLVALALVNPKYAVAFLVYLLLSRPWESYADPMMASMPREISILAMLSLVGHKIIKRDYFFKFNLGTFLILIFATWMLLSAVFSNHIDAAIMEYTEIFTKGIILFLLIQNGIKKATDLNPVKAALILGIIEKSIVSYYKTFLTATPSLELLEEGAVRLVSVGILGNSNDIAAIFILAIPFCFFAILKTKLRPFNWFFAFFMVGILIQLVWESQSRGALLALFATVGAWFFLKIKSKFWIAVVICFAMLAALGTFKLMDRGSADLNGSTDNRIIFWKAGANMAIRNPVFGVGIAGFSRYLSAYAIDGVVGTDGAHMTAHSSWVLILAEGGFVAFFCFFGLWVYAAIKAYHLRRTDPEYFTAMIGYGVAMTFLSHTYLLYPYILTAITIAHYFAIQDEINEENLVRASEKQFVGGVA